eukprot:225753-Hanusia_phi.AAC.2
MLASSFGAPSSEEAASFESVTNRMPGGADHILEMIQRREQLRYAEYIESMKRSSKPPSHQ